jgi:excisionase family DNA binding protein
MEVDVTTKPLLLTPEQAAKALAVGRDRIFQMIANGDLASLKIGKSRRVLASALQEFIDSRLERPQS